MQILYRKWKNGCGEEFGRCLQLLFHFFRLQFEQEGFEFVGQCLKESLLYGNVLKHCLDIQSVVYLDGALVKLRRQILWPPSMTLAWRVYFDAICFRYF